MLEGLSYSEKLLLGYFATQDTDGILPADIVARISKVDKAFVGGSLHLQLVNKNLLERGAYNFTYRELMYRISPNVMVKVLEWLYDTDEGNSILKVLCEVFKYFQMNQKPIQIALCEYIRSNYRNTSEASIIFGADVAYLQPIINDDKYMALLSHITEASFVELVKNVLNLCYQGEMFIESKRITTLAEARTYSTDLRRDEVLYAIYLYAYLAEGKKPKHITDKPLCDAHLLQAVILTFKGQYSDALKEFRKAQVIYNTKASKTIASTNLPTSIANFLYIICCKREGTANGESMIANFIRRNEKTKEESVKAAWALACAFTNRKGYVTDIRLLFPSADKLSKQLMVLLVNYLGRTNIITEDGIEKNSPQWLCIRYDNEKHLPLSEKEHKSAEKSFYENHLLTSIYVKQQWEYVLESLAANKTEQIKDAEQSERLAYFMHSVDDNVCEVRQQQILKSGGWSAGKVVSYATFMAMPDENMDPEDVRIRNRERYGAKTSLYYVSLANVLPEMTSHSRLYVGRWAPYSLVTVSEEMPYLVIERSDTEFTIKSNVPEEQVDKDYVIVSRGASSINYLRMTPELRPYFSQLLDLGKFPLDAEETLSHFLESLRGKVEVHSSLIKGGSTLETVKGTSDITLQMRPQGKEAYIVSIFCRPLANGRAQCVPGEGSSVIFDISGATRVCVERDLEKERSNYYNLVNGVEGTLPPEKTFQVDAFGLLPILDFIREQGENCPYAVEWPEGHKLRLNKRSTASQWSASLKKNKNGWFEMEGTVQLDENTKISIADLLDLIGQSRNRFIRLGEGEYIALSERLHRQLMGLDALASRQRGRLQMSAFSAALLDSSIVDGELQLEVDPELIETRKRILDSSEYKPEIPKTLNATLRGYQVEGYQWIARLNSWGAGALLADDMGLGKTVQTIAYLLFKANEGPALVIAPASVAPNWKTEIERFAPSLNVSILNFINNRSTFISEAKAGDVVICTYGLLLSVKTEITQKEWTTAVLDEAHVIKNRGAKTSGVAMQLKTKYRVMLTGTPVQNHLGELWNLFQFVNPGLLGSYEDFSRRFIGPIEVAKDKERQQQLDRIVHPFMLRRTKEKVLDELPEKTEIYQTVDLSPEEMAVYEIIRENAQQMLEAENSEKVSINALAEITRLRQASCAAQLVEKNWKGKCSKIEALIEALEPIIESGDAALVFSQFTSFLAIVQKALDKAGIPYLYIDGTVSVKERQKLVEKFQNGECPVFIISLKAGGLGLNLTRANYVFHLDPWWNPAIEQQATDRAHRMGQHNAVTVYHFLSSGTIEEKIKRLHEQKRDLAENILEGTDMSGKITGKELLEMIK